MKKNNNIIIQEWGLMKKIAAVIKSNVKRKVKKQEF